MPSKEKVETKIYLLTLELHNKVADCLNHLSVEKESMEDAADALNRVKKTSIELKAMLPSAAEKAGMEYDSEKRLAWLKKTIDNLDKLISESNEKNKEMFSAAGNFAQTWNELEAEIHAILEKLESKSPGGETYIR